MAKKTTAKKTAGSKKPIKVGIVGMGRAGLNMHCTELEATPARKHKYKVVAVCDTDFKRCKVPAEKYGCKSYKRIEDMLKDEDVELISIATRSPDHTPHAIQALKAGKIVFLEKPIALSYAEAKKLQRAAAKYPGKLYLRHNRRFEPAFNHIKEIFAKGILGDVYEIKLHRHNYQRRNDWQTIIKCGGGQLNNWGPHIIDHGLRLLESPVKEIWSDLKKVAAVGDAEDHLKIILKGKNGRIVDLEISGGVTLPQPTYVIFGTKGSLVCDEAKGTIKMRYLNPKQKLMNIRARVASPDVNGAFGNAEVLKWVEKEIKIKKTPKMHDIWDYMYDSIRNGKTFPVTIEEALQVVKVCDEVKKNTKFASK